MAEPSNLWLTDRSRYESGLDRCMRQRLLRFHWGPSGYGIDRKATSIPLAAGKYLHKGYEHVLRYVKETDQLPPDEVVREAVRHALAEYHRVVSLRNLVDESGRLEFIIKEQQALIAGLIWAFVLTTLSWIHEQARIIAVEEEECLVIGCTCGLGDQVGEVHEHEARGCEGIGFQSRPDFLTEYRLRPGVIAYWEIKSTGQTGERFESQWETMVQFAAGAMGAQARLGLQVTEAWVLAALKGRREGDTYNPETRKREGDMRQQSPFCYGYRRPANPPLEDVDWQVKYDYKDASGQNRRLGKAYVKTSIWQIEEDVPEATAAGIDVPEFWAKWMPREVLGAQMLVIGPLEVSQVLCGELLEEMVAEETKWKGIVWELHQVWSTVAERWQAAYALEPGWEALVWTDPEYQSALRRLVPRSWSCRRFGKRYECEMKKICFEHEGWQDPLGSGEFVFRRPHHVLELAQVEARGFTPEEGWAEEPEEGD